MPGSPLRRRLLLGAAGAVPLALLVAGPASAHVTVSSQDATAGGFGKLVFRVPTESEKANTVGLTVTLPADAPFAFVSSQTRPGWAVTTTSRKLAKPVTTDDGFTVDTATSTVTWKATGGGIPPHEFDEFALSLGPFPVKAGTMAFSAVQTYSDGSVVKWDQPTTAGKAEPQHPAPRLTVAPAAVTTDTTGSPTAAATTASGAAGTRADGQAAAAAPAPGPSTTSGDGLARWLGGAAAVVAVLALGLAVLGRRRAPA